MSGYETLRLSRPVEHVLVIALDRPDAANAFNTRMARELMAAFSGLEADDRCLVLTGSGERAFCAGADLKEREGMSVADWSVQHKVFEDMGRALLDVPIPTIAAVNGPAYGGGCEIALLCDFLYVVGAARFALTETTLGIMPGLGATQTLARAAGIRHAKEAIFTGRPFTAEDALAWGVANRVCPPGRLMEEVLATACRIAANAPLAVREVKRAIDGGAGLDLKAAMALELESYNRLVPTQDRLEGVRAWGEKRKPRFTGA